MASLIVIYEAVLGFILPQLLIEWYLEPVAEIQTIWPCGVESGRAVLFVDGTSLVTFCEFSIFELLFKDGFAVFWEWLLLLLFSLTCSFILIEILLLSIPFEST